LSEGVDPEDVSRRRRYGWVYGLKQGLLRDLDVTMNRHTLVANAGSVKAASVNAAAASDVPLNEPVTAAEMQQAA
jgi:hypothetical protein